MIQTFLKFLRYEKRVSTHTLVAYEGDLSSFQDFASKTYHLEDIQQATHSIIRSWIVSLVEIKQSPASINRKIACLRTYYKFLRRQDVIAKDPMLKIRVLKTAKRLPSFVHEKEMIEVLDNPHITDNPLNNCRDQLIIELFYGTGIRLSELINLEEKNIDFRSGTIKVLGKRNKERIIPIGKNLVKELKGYLAMRNRLIDKQTHGFLLVTESGKQLYPMLVYKVVKERLSKYQSVTKKSPHVLRHTYATHLLNNGAEINAVKELLGHSSLAATQVYTHNSIEKIKKIFQQAHPKA